MSENWPGSHMTVKAVALMDVNIYQKACSLTNNLSVDPMETATEHDRLMIMDRPPLWQMKDRTGNHYLSISNMPHQHRCLSSQVQQTAVHSFTCDFCSPQMAAWSACLKNGAVFMATWMQSFIKIKNLCHIRLWFKIKLSQYYLPLEITLVFDSIQFMRQFHSKEQETGFKAKTSIVHLI